jgi:hypothetical protein
MEVIDPMIRQRKVILLSQSDNVETA